MYLDEKIILERGGGTHQVDLFSVKFHALTHAYFSFSFSVLLYNAMTSSVSESMNPNDKTKHA